MMSLGSSESWQTALRTLTSGRVSSLSAAPLLEYFQPLYDWLVEQNLLHNYTVGWHSETTDHILH